MTTRIYLSGGLGNQLFQLAAALFVADGERVVLEARYSHTRKNKDGNPDICGFKLPGNVSVSQVDSNQLVRRSLNFGIRIGAKGNSVFLIKILEYVISFLIFVIEHQRLKVFINRGLGYDPRIRKLSRNVFLVGYFQTYQLVDKFEVRTLMQELCLAEGFTTEDLYLDSETQIYLHLRLGDYLEASAFGIPTVDYYRQAISELRLFREDLRLVVFSDEPINAKDYLRELLSEEDLVLPPSSYSSAEVMQSFRSGRFYVIGNSSFSWWGAYLSLNEQSRVTAPEPWFLKTTTPFNLLPPSWVKLRSF